MYDYHIIVNLTVGEDQEARLTFYLKADTAEAACAKAKELVGPENDARVISLEELVEEESEEEEPS